MPVTGRWFLVVVSLITATRLGAKAGVCLVMETQTGDKFILDSLSLISSVSCAIFIFFIPHPIPSAPPPVCERELERANDTGQNGVFREMRG